MTKKILLSSVFLCVLCGSAFSQNLATVSGANIEDLNGAKLANGQICFLGTDQSDNPISFQVGGGGQALRRQYCAQVSNGAIASFTVPNPAATLPTGIYYRVTVKDTSTGQEVLRYTGVTFSGGTFNFDTYSPNPPGFSPAPLSGNSVTGNLGVTGNISASGTIAGSNIPATIPGTGSCTNQFVRSLNAGAAPTCSTITNADVTSALASPPPIGSTTPNTVAATTLSASGNVTATVGQNQINAYNINGGIKVDGVKYPCSSAGINAALLASPSPGGIVDASGCGSAGTYNSDIFASVPTTGTTGGVLYLPCGVLSLTANWNIPKSGNWRVVGCGAHFSSGQGHPTSGTVLSWTSATAPATAVIDIKDERNVLFEHFSVDCNSVANCVALQYESDNAPASDYNRIDDLLLMNGTVGINLGTTSTTNETSQLHANRLHCVGNTTCVVTESANCCQGSQFSHMEATGGTNVFDIKLAGLIRITDGSFAGFSGSGVLCENATACLMVIENTQMESCGNFLTTQGTGGANNPITIIGSDMNCPINLSVATALVSIGNTYITTASSATNNALITSIGDSYISGAGWTLSGNSRLTQIHCQGAGCSFANTGDQVDVTNGMKFFNVTSALFGQMNGDGQFSPPIGAIGSQATCSSSTEGSHVVANNCNAACTVGGTCTAGGTTHCEMYCTGSGYVETGR